MKSPAMLTIIKRDKHGKVTIKTFGWSSRKHVYTIKGPVTFISVTYRRKETKRRRQAVKATGWSRIHRLFRRSGFPV